MAYGPSKAFGTAYYASQFKIKRERSRVTLSRLKQSANGRWVAIKSIDTCNHDTLYYALLFQLSGLYFS